MLIIYIKYVTFDIVNNLKQRQMKTIEQLTGTTDTKTNLICFLLLSTVIVLTVAFTVLASVNGIKTF